MTQMLASNGIQARASVEFEDNQYNSRLFWILCVGDGDPGGESKVIKKDALSNWSGGLPCDNALGPAEADLGKIEIGMFRADVMEYAGNRAPDPRTESSRNFSP